MVGFPSFHPFILSFLLSFSFFLKICSSFYAPILDPTFFEGMILLYSSLVPFFDPASWLFPPLGNSVVQA